MNKILKFSLIFFFISCSAQKIELKKDCENRNEIERFIKNEIIEFSKKDYFLDTHIITKAFSEKPLEVFLNPNAFAFMRKIGSVSQGKVIDFKKLFSRDDFNYMICQLKENEIKNWRQILEKSSFKKSDSIKNILNNYKTWKVIYNSDKSQEILELKKNYLKYSIPLFNKDRNYALVFRENSFSGNLLILKKINQKWVYFATSFVWSSD